VYADVRISLSGGERVDLARIGRRVKKRRRAKKIKQRGGSSWIHSTAREFNSFGERSDSRKGKLMLLGKGPLQGESQLKTLSTKSCVL